MRITRIFRKYSRVLVLVFMSLLLVIFLIGDVIQSYERSYREPDIQIGTAFGHPVYLDQTRQAEAEFELAARLGLRPPAVGSEDVQKANLAKYLLLEEARRAGIRVSRSQIVEGLRNVQGAAEALAIIRGQTGRSLNSIYDSVAGVQAVLVLAQYQVSAALGASLPELEHLYRAQQQEARVLLSVIDARAFESQVPEPAEDELLAHFDEGKDRDHAHTDDALAHGYRIPDRVQVEYLTVDPSRIVDAVRVSEREARIYYEEHRQDYMKPAGDAPFALEPGAEPPRIQQTFEEVQKQVRDDCRAAKAVLEAQRLVNQMHDEARRPWDTAPLDANGVRQPPPPEAILSFSELQERFSSEYPVSYKKTELVTERDLRREPGFGAASATLGRDRQAVPAARLALTVEGLAAPAAADDAFPPLRLNEPGPVVFGSSSFKVGGKAAQQAYLFRVIAVAPAGPPASLDEVRDKVIRNVKQCKAFELAGQHARALAEAARQKGLKQAVAEAAELKTLLGQTPAVGAVEPATQPATAAQALEPFEPERFVRQPSFIRNIGYSPGLHDKVFALLDESATQPAADQHRVIAVPLARYMKWVVAELLEEKPIYRGDFEAQRETLEQQNLRTLLQTVWSQWFDPDNISARAGFVPATPPQAP